MADNGCWLRVDEMKGNGRSREDEAAREPKGGRVPPSHHRPLTTNITHGATSFPRVLGVSSSSNQLILDIQGARPS